MWQLTGFYLGWLGEPGKGMIARFDGASSARGFSTRPRMRTSSCGSPTGSVATQPYDEISAGGNSLSAMTDSPVRSFASIMCEPDAVVDDHPHTDAR